MRAVPGVLAMLFVWAIAACSSSNPPQPFPSQTIYIAVQAAEEQLPASCGGPVDTGKQDANGNEIFTAPNPPAAVVSALTSDINAYLQNEWNTTHVVSAPLDTASTNAIIAQVRSQTGC